MRSDDDPDAKLNQRERAFAIAYVGAAAGNASDAARLAGYRGKPASIHVTASRVLSLARVKAYIAELNTEIARQGVTLKANRIARRQKRWEQIDAEITARAASTAPGFGTAGTGIMAIEIDSLGRIIIKADTALLREEREIEKQVAIELGEWTEKTESRVDISGEPVSIVEITVGLDPTGRDRVKAEEDAIDREEADDEEDDGDEWTVDE